MENYPGPGSLYKHLHHRACDRCAGVCHQEGCEAREWRQGEACCEQALVRTEYLRGALVAGAAGARLLALSGAALCDVIGCALADYKSPTSSRRRAFDCSHAEG